MSSIRTLCAAAGLALVGSVWAMPGHAAVQRTFLLQSCTAHDQAKLAGCAAFFSGVLETVQDLQNSSALKREVCLPEKITDRQLREGVVNYMQTHPATSPDAVPAVLEALRALYRCP